MKVRCPFCAADDAQLISLFGSQLLLSQYRCRACGSYFEAVREDQSEEVVSHGRRAED
jgi:transposase-like protein